MINPLVHPGQKFFDGFFFEMSFQPGHHGKLVLWHFKSLGLQGEIVDRINSRPQTITS